MGFFRRNQNACLISFLFLISVLFIIPTLFVGGTYGHDTIRYLNWVKYFSDQVWDGDLYPRWLQDTNYGLGSPTFFYYFPMPYYAASLFRPTRIPGIEYISQFTFAACFALSASGFTAYLWLKDMVNRRVAGFCAILYMLAPYHLAIDFYWRGAFSEYWTFVWLPLILWYGKKIEADSRRGILGFAISYALLITTHLAITLAFSLIPLLVELFLNHSLTFSREARKRLLHLGMGYALGIGLSSIYLIPAMTLQDFVSLAEVASEQFTYYSYFLFVREKASTFQYCLIALFFTFLGIAWLYRLRKGNIKAQEDINQNRFWTAILLLSMFMALPISSFIWELFPPLQKIFFPWRFYTVSTLASTAIIALHLNALHLNTLEKFRSENQWNFWKSSKAIAVVSIFMIFTIPIMVDRIQNYSLNSDNIPSSQLEKVDFEPFEYRPQWVDKEVFSPFYAQSLVNQSPRVQVTPESGTVEITAWQPRKILLEANLQSPADITVAQFYYPGWTAQLGQVKTKIPAMPSKTEGLVQFSIPEGQNQVRLTLDAGWAERLGQLISASSVGLLLLLAAKP